VIFQQLLKVGEERAVDTFVPAGNYVLMRADSEGRLAVEAGDGKPQVSARIGVDGVTSEEAQRKVSSGSGLVRFDLANETGHEEASGFAPSSRDSRARIA
jgi:hypothetical protein